MLVRHTWDLLPSEQPPQVRGSTVGMTSRDAAISSDSKGSGAWVRSLFVRFRLQSVGHPSDGPGKATTGRLSPPSQP